MQQRPPWLELDRVCVCLCVDAREQGKCILAMGTTADLGPPEVEFNFPLVLYRIVCVLYIWVPAPSAEC